MPRALEKNTVHFQYFICIWPKFFLHLCQVNLRFYYEFLKNFHRLIPLVYILAICSCNLWRAISTRERPGQNSPDLSSMRSQEYPSECAKAEKLSLDGNLQVEHCWIWSEFCWPSIWKLQFLWHWSQKGRIMALIYHSKTR